MSSGCGHFSVARQGCKVFLPVQYVQLDKAHEQNDKKDDEKDFSTKNYLSKQMYVSICISFIHLVILAHQIHTN